MEKVDETHYRVWVKEPARDGRANEALIKVLSDYFKIPKGHLVLLKGRKSKSKIVCLQDGANPYRPRA